MCNSNMATPKAGYDCDFVNDPPKDLECTICLLTVREPHVITCCGNQFCRPCIERVKEDNKPCPLCNDQDYQIFAQKKVMREVNALLVRCPQKALGCAWEGELGQLQRHLDPEAGNVGNVGSGCSYVEVDCTHNCGGRFFRGEARVHELETCPRRPVEVVVGSIVKRLDALSVENQAIKAENQQLKQQIVQLQRNLEAKAEIIQLIGLSAEVTQLNDSLATKAEAIQLNGLSTKVTQLNDDLATKAEEFSRLKNLFDSRWKHCATEEYVNAKFPTSPFVFSIYNFEHYKKVGYTCFSDPFYTHPDGYKMRARINPNGIIDGQGTHLSLFVGLLPGENDDVLQWPFCGKVTMQAFCRRTVSWENASTIDFSSAPASCRNKPSRHGSEVNSDVVNDTWGFTKYISHGDIRNYSISSIIRFRIKVDL